MYVYIYIPAPSKGVPIKPFGTPLKVLIYIFVILLFLWGGGSSDFHQESAPFKLGKGEVFEPLESTVEPQCKAYTCLAHRTGDRLIPLIKLL